MRRCALVGALGALLLAGVLPVRAQIEEELEPGAVLAVTPLAAEIGDPLEATLTVILSDGERLETSPLGPELGAFAVAEGSWSGPEEVGDGLRRWIWRGRLAAYRTGELEIPAVELRVSGSAGQVSLSTAPLTIALASVLTDEDLDPEAVELSDLKPPASLRARLGPLWTALGVLAALLGLSGLLWWLQRRYRSRFAAVPVADDPFRRTPPHVWIYAELQRLLELRLVEQGQIDAFYAELSRLLKRYLSGRYRVELMERTTAEVPGLLEQAGAPAEAIRRVEKLLVECDGVKFARALPDPSAWRRAVEQVYRVVDTTKPREAQAEPAREGAA